MGTGGSPSLEHPCQTIASKVDCTNCHAQQGTDYRSSTHGQIAAKGSHDAPTCKDCHGAHDILPVTDPA
jgi:formate dehydrogenase maturation protein FdhE